MAYESTSVSVDKSQSEIRKLLLDYGASRFLFGEEERDGVRWVGIEFGHEGNVVRMSVPLKMPDEKPLREKARRAHTKTFDDIWGEAVEQEARRVWRVIFWSLKARMVAVEEQLETFEQAFLAHLVDPASNLTVWQALAPTVAAGAFQSGGMGLLAIEAAPSVAVDDDEAIDAEIVGDS